MYAVDWYGDWRWGKTYKYDEGKEIVTISGCHIHGSDLTLLGLNNEMRPVIFEVELKSGNLLRLTHINIKEYQNNKYN